jgi:hypothetical protein
MKIRIFSPEEGVVPVKVLIGIFQDVLAPD